MIFRAVPICLTILGILSCPYVCLIKTGHLCGAKGLFADGTQYASGTPACCAGPCNQKRQDEAPIVPARGDCLEECVVSKATVEAGPKTPWEMLQSVTDVEWAAPLPQAHPLASMAFEIALRNEFFKPLTCSGNEVRVRLASLLL